MISPVTERVERNGAINGYSRLQQLEKSGQSRLASEARIAHILVAIRLDAAERDTVAMALRMASIHRAKVTLLHVLEPLERNSFHWLDAIDNLHRALSGASHDAASAIEKGRTDLKTFLEREIPREARGMLDIQVECRIGDVAAEIAGFAAAHGADLVLVGNSPSMWRPPFWPRLSQRILSLTPRPVLLVNPKSESAVNGAAH
jgi:nucleotide-binding universal stress UspA family protein